MAPAIEKGDLEILSPCGPGGVIVADSTTTNRQKLLLAALRLKRGLHVILTAIDNFPTDLYAAERADDLLGGRQVRHVETSAIDKDTTCVMLTHVDYRSGRMHDLNCVTRWAHAVGAMMLWDLAHSAAVPMVLGQAASEFALGCGYKRRAKVA